jgi:hypothetical protein
VTSLPSEALPGSLYGSLIRNKNQLKIEHGKGR